MRALRTIPHRSPGRSGISGLAVALAVLISLLNTSVPLASESLVPFVSQLETDSMSATDGEMIIVVMFEYEDCPWCEYVLENEIEPIIRSEAYKSSVIFRRAYISDSTEIASFDGTPTTSRQLADHHAVSISPTLVFLDAKGDVMAPQLVGVSSRDFYGYYLEKRIAEALAKLAETS